MPNTRRAESVLEKWLDGETMLWALAGVVVADRCLPIAGLLRGRLALLENENVLVLKSHVGSFLNITSFGSAKFLQVKSDWQGTMIDVRFQREILIISDYEPPSDFFRDPNTKPREKTNTVFPAPKYDGGSVYQSYREETAMASRKTTKSSKATTKKSTKTKPAPKKTVKAQFKAGKDL